MKTAAGSIRGRPDLRLRRYNLVIEQIPRIWRDRLPILDGVAALSAWNFYIWGVATIDSITRERDLSNAVALLVLTLIAAGVAVFIAKSELVSLRIPSWIIVPAVGSLIWSALAFGLAYIMGGSGHIALVDLVKVQLGAALFVFLLTLPAILFFRICFFTFSYLFGRNHTHPQ